ncbi:MAG: hypothetical protein M3Z35_15370, partial [Nitrospirota bacterium]|nr:hypothetical protein [Nitrospirota bacterium]
MGRAKIDRASFYIRELEPRLHSMIECIFTLDYEIYGDGTGDLQKLVFEPTKALAATFREYEVPFVNFVEVAELQAFEAHDGIKATDAIRRQIYELHDSGNEIGLHLHPQWYNAKRMGEGWQLDLTEYNLSTLPRDRIRTIVVAAIEYLRGVVRDPGYVPVSFRAGNWLLQPSETVASVLAENGIKIDSSVFKGGRQRAHGLDYSRAARNPYFWKFRKDVNIPEEDGLMLEIPTYTSSVPFWKMLTSKRLGVHSRPGSMGAKRRLSLDKLLDRLRFRYPSKLDFCRMTLAEMTGTIEQVIRDDKAKPDSYKPVVAIGHSKDLID